jgi:hypothetical protein
MLKNYMPAVSPKYMMIIFQMFLGVVNIFTIRSFNV